MLAYKLGSLSGGNSAAAVSPAVWFADVHTVVGLGCVAYSI